MGKRSRYMMKKADPTRVVLMIGTLALALGVFDAVAAGPGTVTRTVTACGQKDTSPPLVTKDDVQLFLNKERTQVADWKHGEKLYLAVLIDDSLDSEIAGQWSDLKAFLAGQPDNAYISVAYERNCNAVMAQDLTNDNLVAEQAISKATGTG